MFLSLQFHRANLRPDLLHHLIHLLELVFQLLYVLLLAIFGLRPSRLHPNSTKGKYQ